MGERVKDGIIQSAIGNRQSAMLSRDVDSRGTVYDACPVRSVTRDGAFVEIRTRHNGNLYLTRDEAMMIAQMILATMGYQVKVGTGAQPEGSKAACH